MAKKRSVEKSRGMIENAMNGITSDLNIVDTQMYIDGYQVKLVSDTSYGSLWEVSFTLKEF